MSGRHLGEAILDGDFTSIVGDASQWLGWLHHPDELAERFEQLRTSLAPRHDQTILLGMGGSSSGPGMIAHEIGLKSLEIIDTSHPDTVQRSSYAGRNIIASSKSGGTVETIAALAWAMAHGAEEADITIVTDPGTAIDQLAASLSLRTFYGDPLTGGRFSTLSNFGLVPVVTAGARDLQATVLSRVEWLDAFSEGFAAAPATGWGEVAVSGDPLSSFTALWEEQLLAESTGKDGKGLLPLAGSNRAIRDVVAHAQRTHAFTVGVCVALQVDPFRQPDVEAAKRQTFAELAAPTADDFANPDELEAWFSESTQPLVLQVFGPLEAAPEVSALRARLASAGVSVSAGLGPRYLHSTGQIHKGGSANLRFLQVVVRPSVAPERIQGRNYAFQDLLYAQARGDARVLANAGRNIIRTECANVEQLGRLFH